MPWVYTLELSDYRDASKVQSDWQAITSEGIANDHGGVTVSGSKAIVVSTPREPNFGDMATSNSYVESISESHEIPSRGSSNWSPPHDLGHGIQLVE